jgi:hypothetical protein
LLASHSNREKEIRMSNLVTRAWRILALAACATSFDAVAQSEEPAAPPQASEVEITDPLDAPHLKRLAPDEDAWVDPQGKRVVLGGVICLREGPLEMFACTAGTKEHESIVAVNSKAFAIHAALLAIGAEAGAPVEFRPKYRAASARAQDWIRNVQTRKTLDSNWVFCGSGFWRDEATGQRYYLADDGDLICVSNFPSAMLDLPLESSQANDALLFEANTDQIPPLDSKVTVVLEPKVKKLSSKLKPARPAAAR